jgi:S1-C subfamily serine protease
MAQRAGHDPKGAADTPRCLRTMQASRTASLTGACAAPTLRMMRVTAALLLASATLAAMPARASEEVRFRVVNRTGEIVTGLYVTEPGQGARNLIAGRAMRPGQVAEVTRRGGCTVDLRLVTAGGAVHDRPGTDVCASPEIAIGTAAPRPLSEQAPASAQDLVASAQRLLDSLGFDPGPADGVMGPRTQGAIAAFQRTRGLAPTGQLDGQTVAALRAASAAAPLQSPDGKPPPVAAAPRPGGGPAVAGKPPPAAGPDRPEPIRGGVAAPAQPAPQPAPQDPFAQRPMQRASTGTGFVVAEGRLLSNHHVVANCRAVNGVFPGNRRMPLTVLAADAERDLALLAGPRDAAPVLAFREGPPRRGDEVVTYGFPLTGILGSGPTLTTGEVSALTGLRDDPNTMIISAPVQSGNSGGPLLDRSGNVLGVIVAKLAALRVAERTGDLPQNVNIAIQGRVAIDFLRRNGVTPRTAPSSTHRPAAEVGEIAHPSTVLIECMR